MNQASDHFHWGKLVVSCVKQLREDQALPVRFVDYEVIPPFEGSPDTIFVWFICTRTSDIDAFRSQCLESATEQLRASLVGHRFPPAAASSLQSDVTSLEAIEAGGGRFAYFR